MSAGERIETQVEVEGQINNSTIRRRFNVPIEGGTRLNLSTLLSDNVLEVSNIDRIFGPSELGRIITGLT